MRSRFLVLILIFFCSINTSFSAQLSSNVRKYLRTFDSSVYIRFDGLVTFSDGSVYLPLLPSFENRVKKIETSWTYPENRTFSSRPQVVVLNNNMSFLKIIRINSQKSTLCMEKDLPMVIKTSLLPQDLLVPSGLNVPDTLKGILGNLRIPLISEVELEKSKSSVLSKSQKMKLLNIDSLKNRLIFVTNLDSEIIKVYDNSNSVAKYTFDLKDIPKDIKAIENGRFLYLISVKSNYLRVFDLKEECVVRQIDLNEPLGEIVIDENKNVAYISALNSNIIYKIDNKNVVLIEKISTNGVPYKLTLSEDGKRLSYIDRNSSNLFLLNLVENYRLDKLGSVVNISRIIFDNDRLYALSRTRNMLSVYDVRNEINIQRLNGKRVFEYGELGKGKSNVSKSEKIASMYRNYGQRAFEIFRTPSLREIQNAVELKGDIIKNIPVGQKPVDMIKYGSRIFVLNAKNNEITVLNVNTLKVERVLKLPIGGFSNKLVSVEDGSNIVLVTNAVENRSLVFDLINQKVIGQIPLDGVVSSMYIFNKCDIGFDKKGGQINERL